VVLLGACAIYAALGSLPACAETAPGEKPRISILGTKPRPAGTNRRISILGSTNPRIADYQLKLDETALTRRQCSKAIAFSEAVRQRYRISTHLISSFDQFKASSCDLRTVFKVATGTRDKDAFGEFRLMVIASLM
jgi:hypothetical protein